ncbi:MAG: hypothetical protein ACD_30C00017G0013 [uncultured bacterium]|nr:MAG: hypothetical protein ACD_30C00017G0013 [uncultured bacterium]
MLIVSLIRLLEQVREIRYNFRNELGGFMYYCSFNFICSGWD